MSTPRKAFRRRLLAWVALMAIAVSACLSVAVLVRRNTSRAVERLADVEFETTAARIRQFSSDIGTLHEALLQIGHGADGNATLLIRQRRRRMAEWLANRTASTRGPEEKEIIRRLNVEARTYFELLDAIAARPKVSGAVLDGATMAMLGDLETRQLNLAGEFAVAHDDILRTLLQSSLGSVLWMRNLVFLCVGLLLVAIGAVVVLVYRDVVHPLREQLVESETRIVKGEKLAALGTLAAGVAHEIRNPLTAIKARLYTLRRTLTLDESKEDAQAIANEVDRLERIVRDVLGYARPAEPALGAVDLAAWLRDFAAFVGPETAVRDIALNVEIGATAQVRTDPNQLRQIMLNLVRNAQEALEGRPGRISLGLHRERSPLRGKIADVAVLAVTDDGPGIPAKIQARLFEPFFTTKPVGTGLGLTIAARLLENQGGEIAFQSAPRVGTRFVVRLPVRENQDPILPNEPPA